MTDSITFSDEKDGHVLWIVRTKTESTIDVCLSSINVKSDVDVAGKVVILVNILEHCKVVAIDIILVMMSEVLARA